jgi:hypothetical protein
LSELDRLFIFTAIYLLTFDEFPLLLTVSQLIFCSHCSPCLCNPPFIPQTKHKSSFHNQLNLSSGSACRVEGSLNKKEEAVAVAAVQWRRRSGPARGRGYLVGLAGLDPAGAARGLAAHLAGWMRFQHILQYLTSIWQLF